MISGGFPESVVERELRVTDPFSKERNEILFKYRTCSSDVYGQVSEEQWLLKNIRLFAGRELKPRFYDWFTKVATLPKTELSKHFADIPDAVDNMITEIVAKMCSDQQNIGHIRNEILPQLGGVLFGPGDIPELSKRCVPFFINYFSAFRCSSFYLNEFDATIEYNVHIHQHGSPEERDQIFQNYRVLTTKMLNSPLSLIPIVSSAMVATYSAISRAYFCNIIEHTNALSMDQMKAVDSILRAWIQTLPQSNCLSMEKAVTEASKRTVSCIVIDLLIDHIYSLTVVDFPRSYPTIQTLCNCMTQATDYGRDRLVARLIADVNTRLLTVAEETSVMLDGYATCVESLRELDNSCSIMHRVCGVIKEYLKKRPDTVRKIINYITSEKRDQLAEHLGTKTGTIVDQEEFAGTNDEFLPEAMEMKGYEKWNPDPPDAPAGQSSHVRQSADVFNMLISVYGSKEMFVKEYRKLLAERLTSFNEKDPAFELRYLEVLKQRFNEGELQQCEVMLKDVEDSLRIDAINAGKQCVPINACIISSHFWPSFEQDKATAIPTVLEEGLNAYQETYQQQKPNRRLNWLKSWGWVDVQIELGGVTVNRCVSNAHAAVLYLFAEKEEWTAAEVSERLGISKGVARRRLEWWGNQALFLQELPSGATSEVWKIAASAAGLENARHGEESEDEDQAAIEDVADAADALEAYWMYTRNYIAQNETVRAERIHKIFRMFSSPSAQSPSLEVVNTFLFRKVKQGLLTFQGGSFRVVKENGAK